MTPEQIEAMQAENAQMKADMREVAQFAHRIAEMFGDGGLAKIPGIVLRLSTNPQKFMQEIGFAQVQPIFERYRHLVAENTQTNG